jgi:transcriptional coactivator HFI1/ADA1
MVPICYEEGIVNGAAAGCSEFMNVAAEFYIKEVLSSLFGKVSSNGGSSASFIKTSAYKRQLEKEEEGWLKGEVLKNAGGMLPIEAEESAKRKALTMSDLKLAYSLGESYLGQVPLIAGQILNSRWTDEYEDREEEEPARAVEMVRTRSSGAAVEMVRSRSSGAAVNGVNGIKAVNGHINGPDEMDIDEQDWGWHGTSTKDHFAVGALLDECLAIGE